MLMFLLLLLLETCAFANGLASVSSTYSCGENHTQEFSGNGLLVKQSTHDQSKYFILTTCHLSDGTNPSISYRGQTLKVLSRYCDAKSDLDWLEVESSNIYTESNDLFSYIPNDGICVGHSADSCWTIKAPPLSSFEKNASVLSIVKGLNPYEGNFNYAGAPYKPDAVISFVVGKNISNSMNGIADDGAEWPKKTLGGRLLVPAKIAGGLSGGVLMQERDLIINGEPQKINFLEGIAASYERDFAQSSFVSKEKIAKHLKSAFSGRRGHANDARFRCHNGLLYLDNGNGYREIGPTQALSGSGERADGGDDKSDNTTDPYVKYNILPGLEYQSHKFAPKQQVVALQIGASYLYANQGAIDFLDSVRALGAEKRLPLGSDLAKILQKRINDNSTNRPPIGSRAFEIPVGASKHRQIIGAASFKFLPDGGVSIRIPFRTPIEETLEIELDSYGVMRKPKANDSFRPTLIVTGSESKKDYFIDLRDFYFINTESYGSTLAKNKILDGKPSLRIRRGDSKQELMIEFTEAQFRSESLHIKPEQSLKAQ